MRTEYLKFILICRIPQDTKCLILVLLEQEKNNIHPLIFQTNLQVEDDKEKYNVKHKGVLKLFLK